MGNVEQLTDEERGLYRRIALLPGFTGIIALVYAVIAFRHAPNVADLYNFVYHNARLAKAESPGVFLFAFPLMLIGGSVLQMGKGVWGWGNRGNIWMPSGGGLILLSIVWTAVFFLGSLHRSWLVLHHAW